MSRTDPQDYAWLADEDSPIGVSGCVTVGRPLTLEHALVSFDADVTTAMTSDDAMTLSVERGWDLGTFTAMPADAAMVVEQYGVQGQMSEVLAALSVAGRAASVSWNVEDEAYFSCAENGEIFASFEILEALEDPDLAVPAEVATLLVAARGGEVQLASLGAGMVAQFTGVGFTAEQVSAAGPWLRLGQEELVLHDDDRDDIYDDSGGEESGSSKVSHVHDTDGWLRE